MSRNRLLLHMGSSTRMYIAFCVFLDIPIIHCPWNIMLPSLWICSFCPFPRKLCHSFQPHMPSPPHQSLSLPFPSRNFFRYIILCIKLLLAPNPTHRAYIHWSTLTVNNLNEVLVLDKRGNYNKCLDRKGILQRHWIVMPNEAVATLIL